MTGSYSEDFEIRDGRFSPEQCPSCDMDGGPMMGYLLSGICDPLPMSGRVRVTVEMLES